MFVLALSIGVSVVLLVVTLVRPHLRAVAAVTGLGVSLVNALFTMLLAARGHYIAAMAVEHESASSNLREQVLGEAFTEALPQLLLAGTFVLAVLAVCLYELPAKRARLQVLAAGFAVLAPLGGLAARGLGLHDRTMRAAFAEASPTVEGCIVLDDAVKQAGSFDDAERYEPHLRALSKDCVGRWLAAIDAQGSDAALLEKKAELMHMVMTLKGSKPIDIVAESRLLVDDDQRIEAFGRRADATEQALDADPIR